MKFKIGDRVRGKEELEYIGGKTGTIINIITDENYEVIAVEFDGKIEYGHMCSVGNNEEIKERTAKAGHGWWCSYDELEKINE